MRKNILYISNGSTIGGAENSLLDMLKGVRWYVRPVVIIPQKGMIEDRLIELGIKYYIVRFYNGYGKIGSANREIADRNLVDNYHAAEQLQCIIKDEDIQLIHINSSVSNVGALAALMADIPYVWHIREFLEEDFSSQFWDVELKQKLFKNAGAVISISASVKESYKSKYDLDTIHIYNGLDIEKYWENQLELYNSQVNRFIITGMITSNKGQWDAVRAVKILVEDNEKVHLTIIGRSTDRMQWVIKRFIEANRLEEYISVVPYKTDLAEYRKQCQYSLTTSKAEALGRGTIEAMLAGNIVIGADTAGTKEIIGTDESRGYLYQQGNPYDLAKVIKKAINASDDKKNVIRKTAQEYAKNIFSLESYVDKICELYESVISNHDINFSEKLLGDIRRRFDEVSRTQDLTEPTINRVGPYQDVMKKWNLLLERNRDFKDFFKQHNYKRIGIYGMGNLGCKLYDELVTVAVDVVYVVDQNPEGLMEWVEVKRPDEELKDIDVLVITVINEEMKLIHYYKNKLIADVVGISEVIDWLVAKE